MSPHPNHIEAGRCPEKISRHEGSTLRDLHREGPDHRQGGVFAGGKEGEESMIWIIGGIVVRIFQGGVKGGL